MLNRPQCMGSGQLLFLGKLLNPFVCIQSVANADQVPMVAPFFGCTFGGFLYDLLLFTGESPINTPYLGLYRFIPGMQHHEWDREEKEVESPV